MNQSNLNISNSSNSHSGFSWWDYWALTVCSLGLITNTINLIVFASRKLKDDSYKLMFCKSLANFAYLLLSFLSEFFVYCIKCPITFTYFANLYAIAFGFYLASCLAVFRILIEIILSVRVYSTLANHTWFRTISNPMVIFVFVVSLVFYAEKPAQFVIINTAGTDMYYLWYSDFGASKTFEIISIVQQFVRVFLAVVVLTVINVVNLIQFKRKFGMINSVLHYCYSNEKLEINTLSKLV